MRTRCPRQILDAIMSSATLPSLQCPLRPGRGQREPAIPGACARARRSMRGWVVNAVLVLGFACHPDASAQQVRKPGDVIRIGVQADAFPFAFDRGLGQSPRYAGYAVDLCREVVKGWRRLHLREAPLDEDIEWVPVTPRTRFMKLLAGEIDLECGSTSNTAARRALGVAFSPTIFVSSVGLLVRPELESHVASLMDLVQEGRRRKPGDELVFVTTAGSTSVQHLQDLIDDTPGPRGRKLAVRFGTNHSNSFDHLTDAPILAHAFMMDQVLLAGALATRPKLKQARLKLTQWSPVPGASECYGLMTRKSNPRNDRARDRELERVVMEVMLQMREPVDELGGATRMQELYRRWFQQELPREALKPDAPLGVSLDMPPGPQLSRILISATANGDCP
jgi:glutamate/aspartate transport system substrate-binding protein